MSWQEYQNNDRSEQQELASLRGLISKAVELLASWLQDNPSAGTRVHVLALQKRLADLYGIVERRMERRNEVNDGRVWNEAAADVQALIDKAGGNPYFPDLFLNPWIPAVETLLAAAARQFPREANRTDQMESRRVQNNAKPTQDVEGKSTISAAANAEVAEGKSTNAAAGRLTHSEDYRTVTIRSETYTLTPRQAQMIQILHEAHENVTPDVTIDNILERLETRNSRWQDTWRRNTKARAALIQYGEREGTLRLNL
jgi:hypothetical protein